MRDYDGNKEALMKNGDYILVIAPENYPGKKYRGRYAQEHQVVFWQTHGYLPDIVHHRNGVKTDNRPENLEGLTFKEHRAMHNNGRTMVEAVCDWCKGRFEREARNYKHNGQSSAYCSKQCQYEGEAFNRKWENGSEDF